MRGCPLFGRPDFGLGLVAFSRTPLGDIVGRIHSLVGLSRFRRFVRSCQTFVGWSQNTGNRVRKIFILVRNFYFNCLMVREPL